MRTILFCAAVLMLSACSASPTPQSGSTGTAASPATAPAVSVPASAPVATLPPGGSNPVFSPDGSVRRAKPEEISTGRAPLPSECGGDACSAVTVTWLDPGYRFENKSARTVAIQIWFVSKEDCVRQEIGIAPGQSSGWGNVGFCKPYTASYR